MLNGRPGHAVGPGWIRASSGLELHYVPSDGLFASEWHLRNTGQNGGTAGVDLNVTAVWDDYTGTGVSIGIYDDAVDYNHPDLNDNYDAGKHLVLSGITYEALPMNWGTGDAHGTSVAGIIAAENDGTGTVGIAYDASITGVPILRSSNAIDTLAAMAELERFDIVNNSWGFGSPFSANYLAGGDYWTTFAAHLADAAATGRAGLGTIIVKSAGNNRAAAHETNYDNFTSDRHVIAVGGLDNGGRVSSFSNPGASLLVTAPSSNFAVGITTTDLSGTSGNDSGNYRSNFGGTSAAAPMVTGVVALLLEANPDLGWRDAQEILAYSARRVGSTTGSPAGYEEYSWGTNAAVNWNGGGLHFSNDYGFGLVDALAAVRLAESWTAQGTSANELSATVNTTVAGAIPDLGSVSRTLLLGGNLRIDHVEVAVNIAHPNRGDLKVTLTSPGGTTSILLDRPLNGTDTSDNLVFLLTSNAFWGELSGGNWTVTVTDAAGGNVGTVNSLRVTAYGDAVTTNDVYVFTNEYATASGAERSTLTDSNGGIDLLNAAAVTGGSTLDLRAGAVSTIAGRALTIASGTQIENAYGGDGADTLIGNSAVNQLIGARGDDLLEGGGGNDQLDGGAGQDVARFAGARSRYTITAEAGGYRVTDSLAGGDGSDWLIGVEQAQFSDGLINLDGSSGGGGSGGSGGGTDPNDTLTGTAGADMLDGGAGDDQLFGLDGNDQLIGGTGADRLDGGTGIDRASYVGSVAAVAVNLATNINANGDAAGDQLFGVEDVTGSNFADQLIGDGGANQLLGQDGDDAIDGGAGADGMTGGLGNDLFHVDNLGDVVSENAGEGSDRVIASLGWALGANIEELTLAGTAAINGTGNGLANVITGNAGANALDGAAGNDSLYGNGGNDTLYGRDDADLLEGGDGADLLIGGNGRDDMRGGPGSDRYDFDGLAETAVGSGDRILDFERGIDKIDLSTLDAKTGTKKNDAFTFIGSGNFTGVAGQLHYTFVDLAGTADDHVLVQGDTNGDRIADFEIQLIGQLTALQAGDFIL